MWIVQQCTLVQWQNFFSCKKGNQKSPFKFSSYACIQCCYNVGIQSQSLFAKCLRQIYKTYHKDGQEVKSWSLKSLKLVCVGLHSKEARRQRYKTETNFLTHLKFLLVIQIFNENFFGGPLNTQIPFLMMPHISEPNHGMIFKYLLCSISLDFKRHCWCASVWNQHRL